MSLCPLLLLCLFTLTAAEPTTQTPWAWVGPPDPSGVSLLRLHLDKLDGRDEIRVAPPRFTIGGKNVPLMHMVMLPADDGQGWDLLAWIRKGDHAGNVSVEGDWRWHHRVADGDIHDLSAAENEQLTARWKRAYIDFLHQQVEHHEDHEMELLLLLTLSGDLPEPRQTWKRDDLSRLLCGLAGFNDISDALPPKDQRHEDRQGQAGAMPTPIALPPVEVPGAPAASGSSIARFVPRNCYLLEWADIDTALSGLQTLATIIDAWSPGTWPQSAQAMLTAQRDRLGLSETYVQSLRDAGVDGVGLAGWDPYFAAGTNVLLVLHAQRPIAIPDGHPWAVAVDANTVVIATGERQRDRALSAHGDGISMEHDAGFRKERVESLGKDGETDLGFLYLSDPWLTNFISPRWFIHSLRRRAVDARIRMTTAYRLLHASRHGSDALPSLDVLRNDELLGADDRAWLLNGLTLTADGTVAHDTLGGLYAHPPIDTLSFDTVTAAEAEAYEDFRDLYQRRWQRMDPIALRLLRQADGRIRSRLHISPISNRSDFSGMAEFLPQTKMPHRLVTTSDCATGLSLVLRTESAAPMLGLRLPSLIAIQATSLDFAWTSHLPSTWLDEPRGEDWISHLRLPGAVILPNILIDGVFGSGLIGARAWQPSSEVGIQRTEMEGDSYPLLRWTSPDHGISALAPQPALLRNFRDRGVEFRDTMPCDLHVWIDGDKGYLLRRRLWQAAVESRSLAAWRRRNRFTRIRDYLGLSADDARLAPLLASFPKADIPWAVSQHLMPERHSDSDQFSMRWGSIAQSLENIPPFIRDLAKVEIGISIGRDWLQFDGLWTWDASAQAVDADPVADPVLDFDR